MNLTASGVIARAAASVVAWALMAGVLPVLAQPVLYGGLGGHGVTTGPQASTNDGSLVIVSQTDGSTSVVGHPAGVARMSGIAFALDGVLFGATQAGGGFPPPPGPNAPSELIRIDPETGALISSVTIRNGATGLSIADLAVHPTTGALYGIRSSHDGGGGAGKLYTIDTTTGAATFLGDTNKYFGSIAFTPDGTLYMGAADLGAGGPVNSTLMTISATNGAKLNVVPTDFFFSSLAVRPSDGVMFGGTGDSQAIFRIDPSTGGATFIGNTGTNLVGGLAFRPAAAPPATPDLNQHGLTGSWYEAATSGQGVEVEIFPDLAGPGTGLAQVSWFTFDHTAAGGPERQRWYTLQGNVATGVANASLVIYQNVGGNFNALPITSAQPIGTATLSFAACDQGQLDYTFNDGTGRSGSIPLSRLTQNVTCSTASARPVNADFGFSGNWFDPATSGQGLMVEINPMSQAAFFAWYTYAPGGATAGAAGQRWYTGLSNYTAGVRSVQATLYETTGGLFDVPTTAQQATVAVGTATLAFQSCSAATLTFAFTGGSSAGASGVIALGRVGPIPAGCAM